MVQPANRDEIQRDIKYKFLTRQRDNKMDAPSYGTHSRTHLVAHNNASGRTAARLCAQSSLAATHARHTPYAGPYLGQGNYLNRSQSRHKIDERDALGSATRAGKSSTRTRTFGRCDKRSKAPSATLPVLWQQSGVAYHKKATYSPSYTNDYRAKRTRGSLRRNMICYECA